MCKIGRNPQSIFFLYTPSLTNKNKIEEIREDSICHYHMVIGTNLLCENKNRAWNEETDFNYNINCII